MVSRKNLFIFYYFKFYNIVIDSYFAVNSSTNKGLKILTSLNKASPCPSAHAKSHDTETRFTDGQHIAKRELQLL